MKALAHLVLLTLMALPGCASHDGPSAGSAGGRAPVSDSPEAPAFVPMMATGGTIDGGTVKLWLAHAGGCGHHEYRVASNIADDGVVDVWIEHLDRDADTCEAIVDGEATMALDPAWSGKAIRIVGPPDGRHALRSEDGTVTPLAER